jgi:hypothetical protein
VAKVGTVRILYRADIISHQAAVHPKIYAWDPEHERRRRNRKDTCLMGN